MPQHFLFADNGGGTDVAILAIVAFLFCMCLYVLGAIIHCWVVPPKPMEFPQSPPPPQPEPIEVRVIVEVRKDGRVVQVGPAESIDVGELADEAGEEKPYCGPEWETILKSKGLFGEN